MGWSWWAEWLAAVSAMGFGIHFGADYAARRAAKAVADEWRKALENGITIHVNGADVRHVYRPTPEPGDGADG